MHQNLPIDMELTQLLPRIQLEHPSSHHPIIPPGHWSLWNRCIRGHCAPVDHCVTPPSQSRHMPCPDSRECPGLDVDPLSTLQTWQPLKSTFSCCLIVWNDPFFLGGISGISELWEMLILELRLHRSIFHANLQGSSKLHTQQSKVCQ